MLHRVHYRQRASCCGRAKGDRILDDDEEGGATMLDWMRVAVEIAALACPVRRNGLCGVGRFLPGGQPGFVNDPKLAGSAAGAQIQDSRRRRR
jgi:hypothetical protein